MKAMKSLPLRTRVFVDKKTRRVRASYHGPDFVLQAQTR
jgi:hypothetical protein